ncbi:MAG: NAD(P)-dependent oxidoreductase, partial [Candidatus Methanosuratincola sp.]|nr:NAD(P)-dependent oxidoreductase [Candidatus Methanosuratincola sp.]
ARNLLRAGHEIVANNRSRRALEELVALGAKAADSPKEVAERSDVVITMLPDTPDVQEVLLGGKGVIHGVRPGMIVVDMSTISPKATREIAHAFKERGVEMLDAPVSGGQKGAVDATLSIMVGGERDAFERCMPIFKALGKTIVLLGPSGAGQTVKLCNQVICAINIVSMCEGISLCKKAGVDIGKMVEVVSGGLGASNIITNLAPKIIKGDMAPGFKLRLQQKDVRLALQLAEELRLPLPVSGLTQQIFRMAEARGLGEDGTQALIRVYEDLGFPPKIVPHP